MEKNVQATKRAVEQFAAQYNATAWQSLLEKCSSSSKEIGEHSDKHVYVIFKLPLDKY